ncbi:MAG: SAF domain-containing protein, partial [Bryobacteraceae bacterium]
MKKNLVPLLGIAFVVAIVATGIFYGLFVSKIQSGGGAPSQSIVVAARAIDRGTALQKADLKLTTWGAEVPKGAFRSVDTASGATALHPMAENEPVLQSRVATSGG